MSFELVEEPVGIPDSPLDIVFENIRVIRTHPELEMGRRRFSLHVNAVFHEAYVSRVFIAV